MDTTGFSQVGRYGTLSLLKRRSSTSASNPPSSPSDLITSFGIDEAKLTFGSTTTCGVRLYYADVDPLHCQLVFEEGKAFLSVLGQAGVFVDGCWVYPHSSSSGSNSSTQEEKHQQTIIPLSNNSEFEIHQKRFRFTYPPKDIRKVLLATPAPVHKRALRLSMIQSAQVFSPRPSKDPRENLRILQSPLKQGLFPPQTPRGAQTPTRTRAVSPLKYSSKSGSQSDDSNSDNNDKVDEQGEKEAEEEIVLVTTNHPRVVEEDSDLVILEDVPFGAGPANMQVQAPAPVHGAQDAAAPPPPRTPRRKSLGGNALHRAVLIRSAQRAVWRAEREKEEEEEREEEMEVLGAVVRPVEVGDDDDEDEEEYDDEDHDVEMRSVSSEDEGSDEEQDAEALARKEANKSLWRKSLERIIPWGFGASADEDKEEEDVPEDDEQIDEEEVEEPAPLPVKPAQTPIRRVLGSFMTPQPQNQSRQEATQPALPPAGRIQAPMAPPGLPGLIHAAGPGRYSLGGGEARRVLVQQPWRVRDLVVPPPAPSSSSTTRPGASSTAATPSRDAVGATVRPTPVVTAEERRAIQERRRSAVREVREDTFWKDGAPGMSPAKTSARMSLGGVPPSSSPIKPTDAAASVARRSIFASPTKGRTLGYAIAEEDGDTSTAASAEHTPEDDEDALDTRSLLDRMRETVEDMKRRRSMAAGTPRPEVGPATLGRAAPTPAGAPTSVALASPPRAPGAPFALGSVKKLDFSRISSPAVRAGPMAPADRVRVPSDEEDADEADAAMHEEEPFSLLRRNALEGTPSTSSRKLLPSIIRQTDQKAHDLETGGGEDDVRAVPLPAVMVNEVNAAEEANEEEDLHEPKEAKVKTRGRSKLLRPRKAAAPEVASDEEVAAEIEEASHSRVKAKVTRSRRAKSPAPPVMDEPAPTLAPPVTRRQRSKTPQPPPEGEVEPHTTRSGRTRKGTTEPEEPAPAPAKRGRKAHVEPSHEEQEQGQEQETKKTPAAKRGRKPRAAPAEHEEETVVEAPAPAPAPTKRSRSRKAAAPEPTPSQDGDELDSYDVDPSSSKQSSIPAKAPPKERKKAAAVKQEPIPDEEVENPVPLAATRGGRTARTAAAAKTPAASKVAVPKTAPSKITKPKSKLKTPGSAPAATTRTAAGSSAAANAEKENTHETTGSGSAASEEVEDAPVKVRVSRRTGGAAAALDSATKSSIPRSAPKTATRATAKSKVKVEDNQDQEAEAEKVRTTRVTRTRTKAG